MVSSPQACGETARRGRGDGVERVPRTPTRRISRSETLRTVFRIRHSNHYSSVLATRTRRIDARRRRPPGTRSDSLPAWVPTYCLLTVHAPPQVLIKSEFPFSPGLVPGETELAQMLARNRRDSLPSEHEVSLVDRSRAAFDIALERLDDGRSPARSPSSNDGWGREPRPTSFDGPIDTW